MKAHRMARVSEVVREVAAEAILFEIRDPRVKNVTVTRAEVSGDLQHAKVFVSVMGSEKEQQLTMHGLLSSAGFVQSRLAKRLTTRFVPHVSFVLDPGVKKSIEIARLIREAQGSPVDVAGDAEETDDTDGADDAGGEEHSESDDTTAPQPYRADPADGAANG